jgi:hypothetical protein
LGGASAPPVIFAIGNFSDHHTDGLTVWSRASYGRTFHPAFGLRYPRLSGLRHLLPLAIAYWLMDGASVLLPLLG